ncbi:hypothetical protein Rsub_10303 [Raphidocelis subcapitata]|uniref:Uncharacterized protein n=1 Tax=Raphidocelis subcapitata TaxID=307507 RepID=A0A2V0PM06_9CHLO|nr:hypothetical protein Rsub_10303 [Raphidocelis subcapitata]|eukprot:GBF98075.1 hypothetical protein Rsub_10303 [Raphidocelis subcapitata]
MAPQRAWLALGLCLAVAAAAVRAQDAPSPAGPAAAPAAAAPGGGPTVRLLDPAAAPALKYSWSVAAAANPPGLSVRGDGVGVGSVEYSVRYARAGPARTWLLTGAVEVVNPANGAPVSLSEVQVEAQLQAPGGAPVSKAADCATDAAGGVSLQPGGRVTCPFALELPHGSATRAVSLVAQASLANAGGQRSSAPATLALSAAAAAPPVELGRCAVLTDTFSGPKPAMPRALYGSKRPDLGAGARVCEPAEARYVASFGPYSGLPACGTYRLAQVARANPLGGDQLTALASTSVMLVVEGCTDAPPAAPAAAPLLPPLPLPAAPSAPQAAEAQAAAPGPAPLPAAAAAPPVGPPAPAPVPPPSGSGGYEYSYEYEYEPHSHGGDITYDDESAAKGPAPSHRRRLQQSREWIMGTVDSGPYWGGGGGYWGDGDVAALYHYSAGLLKDPAPTLESGGPYPYQRQPYPYDQSYVPQSWATTRADPMRWQSYSHRMALEGAPGVENAGADNSEAGLPKDGQAEADHFTAEQSKAAVGDDHSAKTADGDNAEAAAGPLDSSFGGRVRRRLQQWMVGDASYYGRPNHHAHYEPGQSARMAELYHYSAGLLKDPAPTLESGGPMPPYAPYVPTSHARDPESGYWWKPYTQPFRRLLQVPSNATGADAEAAASPLNSSLGGRVRRRLQQWMFGNAAYYGHPYYEPGHSARMAELYHYSAGLLKDPAPTLESGGPVPPYAPYVPTSHARDPESGYWWKPYTQPFRTLLEAASSDTDSSKTDSTAGTAGQRRRLQQTREWIMEAAGGDVSLHHTPIGGAYGPGMQAGRMGQVYSQSASALRADQRPQMESGRIGYQQQRPAQARNNGYWWESYTQPFRSLLQVPSNATTTDAEAAASPLNSSLGGRVRRRLQQWMFGNAAYYHPYYEPGHSARMAELYHYSAGLLKDPAPTLESGGPVPPYAPYVPTSRARDPESGYWWKPYTKPLRTLLQVPSDTTGVDAEAAASPLNSSLGGRVRRRLQQWMFGNAAYYHPYYEPGHSARMAELYHYSAGLLKDPAPTLESGGPVPPYAPYVPTSHARDPESGYWWKPYTQPFRTLLEAGPSRKYSEAEETSPLPRPSVSLSALSVSKPVAHEWAPRVVAQPSAVVVARGGSATVSYTVRYARSQRASGHVISGAVRITNPTPLPLALAKVSVEVPRPAGAAAAWSRAACPVDARGRLLPVPARGSVACAFRLPYVSSAAVGSTVARVVVADGTELSSVAAAFDTGSAARQVLGTCALVSDTFSRPDATHPWLLVPSALNTSSGGGGGGGKAPELPATRQLCGDSKFTYTARIGPISAATPCGAYKMVTTARASPTNGTQPSAAATSTVLVQVTGCPPAPAEAASVARLLATGGPLATLPSDIGAAAAVGAAAASAARAVDPLDALLSPGLAPEQAKAAGPPKSGGDAALKLPLLAAAVAAVRPLSAGAWSVRATPVPAKLTLPYTASADARVAVVYSRAPASAGGRVSVSGRVALSNPNLLEGLPLARVQVELFRPGAGGRGAVALATCPRAADGLLSVDSQLTGSGRLECAFALEADAAEAGPGAALAAVAVLPDGREAASEPVPLPALSAAAPAGPSAGAGDCVAVANEFVTLGDDGARLMPRLAAATAGGDLLPGEGGGGRAADVICDNRTVTYTATFGPFAANQCGTYTATNLAKADPIAGPQRTASALSDLTLTVTGCPGAVVRADVLDVAPQLLAGSEWGLTAFADAREVRVPWSKSVNVEFTSSYVPAPASASQMLVGAVRLQNLGTAPASLAGVEVEVSSGAGGAPASVEAECPLGADGRLAAGVSLICRFAAPYPTNSSGAVVARALLAGGAGERASRPRVFDFQQSFRRVDAGGCAIAADGFASGPGLLAPNSTTRPAEAEAPRLICDGQTYSFGARLGPFDKRACGTYSVTYAARVNPVAGDLPVPSQSATASVRLSVTGCPKA